MLMLLSSSSLVHADEQAEISNGEVDIELLEFLGDIAGLESLGVDLDKLLGIDDFLDVKSTDDGGIKNEN